MIKAGKNCCVLTGTFDEIYVRNWQGDSEMSDVSPRPVQNKVIKQYVDNLLSQMRVSLQEMSDQITALQTNSGEKIIYF